jgi:hypothetical protein
VVRKLITRGSLDHLAKYIPALEELCDAGAETDIVFSADLLQKPPMSSEEEEEDENYDPNVSVSYCCITTILRLVLNDAQ